MSSVLVEDAPVAGEAPPEVIALLREAGSLVSEALSGVQFGLLDDAVALEVMAELEVVGRQVDGARVRSAADVGARAETNPGGGSLAERNGCRNKTDLITRVCLVSAREAKRRMQLGEAAAERMIVGRVLPARFPAVAAGLASGELGVESAEAIVTVLGQVSGHCSAEALGVAERSLVASATGQVTEETVGLPGAGFAFSADLVRGQAQHWQARLDPDGAAPAEPVLAARSNIGFGQFRSGLYPLRGGVTPELRGILNTFFDAHLGAKPSFPTGEQQALLTEGEASGLGPNAAEFTGDTRTGGEKRADILRDVVSAAARQPGTPRLGGAAPTVLIHVNAQDLADDCGVGWADGVDAPVSLSVVKRMICTGGYRKVVFGDRGEVLYYGLKERFFTSHQRRAIIARDGGCIIPGCSAPVDLTEIHHVIPWEKGGPTDVTNGVCLCKYDHSRIDSSGWDIRMRNGKPEVRGPLMFDPGRTWWPAQKHRANTPTDTPPWKKFGLGQRE